MHAYPPFVSGNVLNRVHGNVAQVARRSSAYPSGPHVSISWDGGPFFVVHQGWSSGQLWLGSDIVGASIEHWREETHGHHHGHHGRRHGDRHHGNGTRTEGGDYLAIHVTPSAAHRLGNRPSWLNWGNDHYVPLPTMAQVAGRVAGAPRRGPVEVPELNHQSPFIIAITDMWSSQEKAVARLIQLRLMQMGFMTPFSHSVLKAMAKVSPPRGAGDNGAKDAWNVANWERSPLAEGVPVTVIPLVAPGKRNGNNLAEDMEGLRPDLPPEVACTNFPLTRLHEIAARGDVLRSGLYEEVCEMWPALTDDLTTATCSQALARILYFVFFVLLIGIIGFDVTLDLDIDFMYPILFFVGLFMCCTGMRSCYITSRNQARADSLWVLAADVRLNAINPTLRQNQGVSLVAMQDPEGIVNKQRLLLVVLDHNANSTSATGPYDPQAVPGDVGPPGSAPPGSYGGAGDGGDGKDPSAPPEYTPYDSGAPSGFNDAPPPASPRPPSGYKEYPEKETERLL